MGFSGLLKLWSTTTVPQKPYFTVMDEATLVEHARQNPDAFGVLYFTTLPSLVTSPLDGSSPLTFRLNWVMVSTSTRGDSADGGAAILKFDPGKAAKVGQEWRLDQTFPVNAFNFHFTKARLKAA